MKVAIIVAMEEELSSLQPIIKNHKNIHNIIKTLYFLHNDLEIYTLISGIGKVNAAIATSIAILQYNVDFVLNVGSCGGIKNAKVGSFILSNSACYSDVDVTPFGYKIGQIPNMPEVYTSAYKKLNFENILSTAAHSNNIFQGTILTADKFINSTDYAKNLASLFNHSIAIEMEAAAIAQCCYKFSKEYLFIKKVSDMADDIAQHSFSDEINKMGENTINIIDIVLNELSKNTK